VPWPISSLHIGQHTSNIPHCDSLTHTYYTAHWDNFIIMSMAMVISMYTGLIGWSVLNAWTFDWLGPSTVYTKYNLTAICSMAPITYSYFPCQQYTSKYLRAIVYISMVMMTSSLLHLRPVNQAGFHWKTCQSMPGTIEITVNVTWLSMTGLHYLW
jgi:hypothetical protein